MNEKHKEKRMNFWKHGKLETKKFYELELHPSVNIKSFILGLLIAALIILPLGILIFQYLMLYGYKGIFNVYLLFIWLGLLLFNGLSNYFTVKIAQACDVNNHRLQALSAKNIFLYNCLNIGFAILTFFIIIVLGLFVFV